MPGGQHFARLSPDGKQVLRYDFQTGKQDGVLFDVAQIEDCPFETVEGYVVSPDGSKMGKGITLSKEEAAILKKALDSRDL